MAKREKKDGPSFFDRALEAFAFSMRIHETGYDSLTVGGKRDLSWVFNQEKKDMFKIDDYLKMDHKNELFTIKLDNESLKGKRLYGEEFRVRPLDGAQRLDFLDIGRNAGTKEEPNKSQYRAQLEFILANCIIDESRKCSLGPAVANRLIREDFDVAMALFDKILELSGMIDKAEENIVDDAVKNSDTTSSESSTDGSANGTASTQG